MRSSRSWIASADLAPPADPGRRGTVERHPGYGGWVSVVLPPDLVLARPVWRGRLHSWAFFASIPAGVLLIAMAQGAAAIVGASIYAATLLLLFGTSASYHRLAHSVRARTIMQRLDHSMIYLLIAGTYVPLCLVALPRSWGIPMLAVIGTLAALGMVLKLAFFHGARHVSYSLYIVMGWVAIIATPALIEHLTAVQLSLIVAGGLAYTVGFPVLLVRRPNPWPATFGYHEVWHLLTVVAAGLHFAAIADVLA
jgi:hemolysin III